MNKFLFKLLITLVLITTPTSHTKNKNVSPQRKNKKHTQPKSPTKTEHEHHLKVDVFEIQKRVVYDKNGQQETVKYHILPTLRLNEYQQQQKKIEPHDHEAEKIVEELTKLDEHGKQFDLYNKKLNEIIEWLTQLEKRNLSK